MHPNNPAESLRNTLPLADEILSLDVLTLREHTESAGDTIDSATQHSAIQNLLAVSELALVRRNGQLLAYAMLQPRGDDCWFVTGFNTHPAHRSAPVFREIFAQISAIAARRNIAVLQSNVYKTNRLSMAFHRRLGFKITRENTKGVEFTAALTDLTTHPFARERRTPYMEMVLRG
ncbi:MAG: GNAT family N-acetyltransferase [Burkholderiales bacterium]|nr:GNAT family N-acetyltransferase [Burkholderiales bacterium]